MSRRSSISSSVSASAKSGNEDDPLMRDCYDLRRRLLQTEQSLQNLNPPSKSRPTPRKQPSYETQKEERGYRVSPDDQSLGSKIRGYSSSPESQVLTLADLTPPTSDVNISTRFRNGGSSLGISQPLRSSYPDLRNGTSHLSPRDAEDSRSFHSTSDYDHDTLRKKLVHQREENSHLVGQNHKLMSDLENASYELHQAKNKVKIVGQELENERKRIPSLEDRIVALESELASQEDSLRFAQNSLDDCREELHLKTEELSSVLETSSIAESELREEAKLRKRAEEQLQSSLRNVEELSEKVAEQEADLKAMKKQSVDREKYWKEKYNSAMNERDELLEKSASFEVQIVDLQEEIRLLQAEGIAKDESQTAMQQEHASLRATISRQSQKVGRLETELRRSEPLYKQQGDLQALVERQREKIRQYQQEIDETKMHMARLEELVHQVQEHSMKEHVNVTPSTSDSGIGSSSQTRNGYSNISPGSNGSFLNGDTAAYERDHVTGSGGGASARAVIADLKLKLAVKDAEIQKLQASAVARAAAQQKHIAGLAGDGGVMDGLRSELSAIVERSRMGDRKQQELEQLITKLEDEVSRASAQNIQLEERLADKMAQIAAMESKLGQRNLRVVDLQRELEGKITEINGLQRDLRQKASQFTALEREMEEKRTENSAQLARLRELQQQLQSKASELGDMQGSLEAKDNTVKEANTLVDKVKALHVEHCSELEQQIDALQRKFEEKNALVLQLETSLAAAQQELSLKNAMADQLERTVQEHKQQLASRTAQSQQHNDKLRALEEQAGQASGTVQRLEGALAECRHEIDLHIRELDDARRAHEAELSDKLAEIAKLEKALQQTGADLQQRNKQVSQLEGALSDRKSLLHKEQERVQELEEAHARLQQRAAALEQELLRETSTAQTQAKSLEARLQDARADLEERTLQMTDMNSTLRDVHRDMKQSSASIVELEQLLSQARAQSDKKGVQVQSLDQALGEARALLAEKTKQNEVLGDRLKEAEAELEEKAGQVTQLGDETSKIEGELQDTISQLKNLQGVLESSQRAVQEKEKKVEELDKLLNESMDELQQKERNLQEKESRVAELDQTLKEQHWELKQKTAQVTQLDITMKEHKSDLQQKVIALDHSLNQARYELSERAVEVAELKARLDQSQEQLKQKKSRSDHLEKTVKQQQQELKRRAAQLAELEKELEKLKKRREDSEETGQELRLAREQLQNTHAELMEARRELLKGQRREQELIQELDDAHALLTTKEEDCTRLAKELGSAQVREAQAEARCVQEVRRAAQQFDLKQVTQEHEIQRLQESHAKVLANHEENNASHRLEIQRLSQKDKQQDLDLLHLQDDNKKLAQDNDGLAAQLRLYHNEAKAANETLVIKEAEIARLEAKLSGYERATFGSKFPPDGLGIGGMRSPRDSAHARRVTSPRVFSRPSHSGAMKKSTSDQNLRNLSDPSHLVNFAHLNGHGEGNEDYSAPAITLSQLDHSKGRAGQAEEPGGLEQVSPDLNQDAVPVLLSSQATDGSAAAPASLASRGQLSPPERQVNGRTAVAGGSGRDADSSFEDLHAQMDKKKKALTGSRDTADDMPSLDPEKCRASLQERLRVNEVRRKNIDQQLLEMQGIVT